MRRSGRRLCSSCLPGRILLEAKRQTALVETMNAAVSEGEPDPSRFPTQAAEES